MFDGNGTDDTDFERAREQLIERLRASGRVEDECVLDTLRSVPRHEFVPEDRRGQAYRDTPLPIGEGQTISAPHMVAIMLERLELRPGETVLEIGTGRGYHAATTAEIVGPENVYTVEYHPKLADLARDRLAKLGYGDVSIRVGDGREGWPEHAPYEKAYLTCAAEQFPAAVIDQLEVDGYVLGPIGSRRQELVLGRKRPDGTLERSSHGGVRFVQMQ